MFNDERLEVIGPWKPLDYGISADERDLGEAINYTFTGNSLEIHTYKDSHHSKYLVYLDNVFLDTVNVNAEERSLGITYQIDNLASNVPHEVSLKAFDYTGSVVFRKFVTTSSNTIECPECPICPICPPGGEPIVYDIIRQGRYQVVLDGVALEGEHNEETKAIERAMKVKAQFPNSSVTILSPSHRIE
jgi:hypothetical protein